LRNCSNNKMAQRTSLLRQQLYRSILRHAGRFDRSPAYKALLSDNRNLNEEPLTSPLREFLGNRQYYLPKMSLVEFLQRARKSELDLAADAGMQWNDTISFYFSLLRQLNMVSFVGEQAGLSTERNASAVHRSTPLGGSSSCTAPASVSMDELKPGTLLIAHPLHLDPVYMRRVVIVLANDTTNRTVMGVAINGKRSTITLDRLVAETSLGNGRKRSRRLKSDIANRETLATLKEAPVFCGGPDEGLVCLHRSNSCKSATLLFGDAQEGASPMYYGGNFVELAASVASGDNTWRCFNGLHYFQSDQLKDEIEEGCWIVSNGFSTDYAMQSDIRWASMLRGLGGEYAAFAELDQLSLDHFNDPKLDGGEEDELFVAY